MKLYLEKTQEQSLGTVSAFILHAQVRVTSEEEQLIGRYNASKEILLFKETKIPLSGISIKAKITIGTLTKGQVFRCSSIAEILEYEHNVKEACGAFKKFLQAMKEFKGCQIIEYSSFANLESAPSSEDLGNFESSNNNHEKQIDDSFLSGESNISLNMSEEPVECMLCRNIIPVTEERCPKCGWSYKYVHLYVLNTQTLATVDARCRSLH